MTAQLRTTDVRAEVTEALRTVRDPELDESIVDLGFVTETSFAGGRVEVRLRLPTYFCAPNFAYLMVADAYDAVFALQGVDEVSVVLEDHFAANEINAGVAAGTGFVGAFPGEAAAELRDLRVTFQRKAHTACLERACGRLLRDGWTIDGLSSARLGDLPDTPERTSLLKRRADIGLPVDDDAPVFVGDDGGPVAAEDVPMRLRFARTVRVSVDGNAHFCRGLLTTRYPHAAADQRPREHEPEASR